MVSAAVTVTSPHADTPPAMVAALGLPSVTPAGVGPAVGTSARSAGVGEAVGGTVGENVSPGTVGARDDGAEVGTKGAGLSEPWSTRDHDVTDTDATESVEVSKVQTPTGLSSQPEAPIWTQKGPKSTKHA